ncbi:hypothetical protein PFISCL1PPCAC_13633, partial [Pristionchus fissidentatus]
GNFEKMDHQHLLQSLWRRQHSLTGSSLGSTESSIDSTTSAYSSTSTTSQQLPILEEEDSSTMEFSPSAGSSSSPTATPSPPFCLFPTSLLSTSNQTLSGPSSLQLLQQQQDFAVAQSKPLITPPPSYQTALLHTLKMPDLDRLVELAALMNSAAAAGGSAASAASMLLSSSLVPPPLPTTQPPRDFDQLPLDLSTKQQQQLLQQPSPLLAPAHFLLRPATTGGYSTAPSTAAATPVATTRPSVILDGTNLRRSASSVTASNRPVPDVNEHFQRSLSGKWPRRVPATLEERRPVAAAPFRRPPSAQSASSRASPAPSCNNNNTIVITTNSSETIEDYFRRALGVEEFEEWKRSREEMEDRRRRQQQRF